MSDLTNNSLNQSNAAFWAHQAVANTGISNVATAPPQPISSDLAVTGEALARAHSLILDIAARLRGPRPEAVGDAKPPTNIIDMARFNRQRTETLVDHLAELLSAL